jgi:heme-degrading monooxygenase HmoA
VIVRVFRAKVRSGEGDTFEEKVCQLSIPLVRQAGGMVAFYSGRPLPREANEFVMVTVWRDEASLIAFAGADWTQAVIPAEERPLLEQTWVHHYEVIGSSGVA